MKVKLVWLTSIGDKTDRIQLASTYETFEQPRQRSGGDPKGHGRKTG